MPVGMKTETETREPIQAKPRPETMIRTFVRATITKMKWDKSKSGVGICRITVADEPAGPASRPARVTLYIRDGGDPERWGALRPDESRRCRDGLRIGDVIEAVGILGPEREAAERQEVIVTEEVRLRWSPRRSAAPTAAPEAGSPSRHRPAPTPRRRPVVTTRRRGGSLAQQEPGGGSARHAGPRVVLFSGSRRWTDPEPVGRDLDSLPPGSLVIEGGAPGLDSIVRKEAPRRGLHVATVPALWDYFDKPAGYRRNEAMLMLQPEELFAYPLTDSVGTRHMMDIAERMSVQVKEA